LPGQPQTSLFDSIGRTLRWLEFNGFGGLRIDSMRLGFGEKSAKTICGQ
jgi:hypothetical protein